MTTEPSLETFAIKSYRYLRLSIVVVIASLMAAVLYERTKAPGCWQEAISRYYYTPVQTMFVGTLLVIGVALIAIKGSTDIEDMLLNVAGVLAPIVAFVPTDPPKTSCTSAPVTIGDANAGIDNNIVAFAIGGAIALLVAFVIARLTHKPAIRQVDNKSKVGLLLGLALLTAGLVWHFAFHESFLRHAHGGAAIVMFVLIGIVMVISAFGAARPYSVIYALCAATMAVAAVAVIVGKMIDKDWRHQILWLEIFELLPFAVFWMAQSFELWDKGAPSGEARRTRASGVPLVASTA